MLKINAFCPKMLTFFAHSHRKKLKIFYKLRGENQLGYGDYYLELGVGFKIARADHGGILSLNPAPAARVISFEMTVP